MATRKTKSKTPVKTTRPTSKAPAKPVKSAAVKSPEVKSAPVTKAETPKTEHKTSSTSSTRNPLQNVKIKRTYLILGVLAIALIGLAIYYRQLFVVAMVNGQPITRWNYIKETESVYLQDARVTAGKQALNQIVTKTLLYQEADKKNITVSEKEINADIDAVRKNLEKSGQKLESALALQGDTLEAYKERVKIQKILEKLVGPITVSDKEVNDYITQNKESLPQDTNENDLKNQVKESLKQQKFNEKVQNLIQDLQKKAKVTYLITQ